MKVEDLIAKLQKLDQELDVIANGYDANGDYCSFNISDAGEHRYVGYFSSIMVVLLDLDERLVDHDGDI